MTKPDLRLIEGGLGQQPPAEPHVPETHEQGEMPFAVVDGEPVTQMPKDLYIPPDALQVFLEAFEGPLDLLLYLIRHQRSRSHENNLAVRSEPGAKPAWVNWAYIAASCLSMVASEASETGRP